MLQGCLVAALPVVAGGALATRDAVRESQQPTPSETPVGEVSVDGAPLAVPPASSEVTGVDAAETGASDQTWRVTELADLPAPTTSARGDPGTANAAYSRFTSYALSQAALTPSDAASAVLANPGSLDGRRAECADLPPAVLIDLDPENGLVPIDYAVANNPDLAAHLEELRRRGVTVGWISGRLMIDAEHIRARLAEAGLDPLGEDTLLLMRRFDERKQGKRQAFASDYCLVAIAGDTLSDFDELFDYLKNQDMAIRLSGLRDAGWFMTPLPLTTE